MSARGEPGRSVSGTRGQDRARDARPEGRDPQPCRRPRAAKRAWPPGGTAASAAGQPGREAMRPDHRHAHPRKTPFAKPPCRPPHHAPRPPCPLVASRSRSAGEGKPNWSRLSANPTATWSAEPGRAKRARGPARPTRPREPRPPAMREARAVPPGPADGSGATGAIERSEDRGPLASDARSASEPARRRQPGGPGRRSDRAQRGSRTDGGRRAARLRRSRRPSGGADLEGGAGGRAGANKASTRPGEADAAEGTEAAAQAI